MPTQGIEELIALGDQIKYYWEDIVNHLKTDQGKIDLGYIWTEEVRNDFNSIEKDLDAILFFLNQLHSHYKNR